MSKQKDKEFYKRLKEIQKEHTPPKYNRCKPYNWKKEWGPFVKYDCDWAGEYLLDLIIYKIEKMYISLDIYSMEVPEDLIKRLASMKEAIDLGKKILKDEYYEESSKFGDEHCKHYVYIYAREPGGALKPFKDRLLIHKLLQPSVDDQIKTKDFMGHDSAVKWCEENGFDLKEVEICYGGEWDSDENSKTQRKMITQEVKNRQADLDKFFKIIAKHIDEWCY